MAPTVHRLNHVGSWLRPEAVKQLRQKAAKGDIEAADLRSQTDPHIAQVVKEQQKAGIKDISDGASLGGGSSCRHTKRADLAFPYRHRSGEFRRDYFRELEA